MLLKQAIRGQQIKGLECAEFICKVCNQKGHRLADCPQQPDKKACSNYSSLDYSTKKCTITMNQEYALARLEASSTVNALLTLEPRAHKEAFPQEYDDPADNIQSNDAGAEHDDDQVNEDSAQVDDTSA